MIRSSIEMRPFSEVGGFYIQERLLSMQKHVKAGLGMRVVTREGA
jgi:hypothetical protein